MICRLCCGGSTACGRFTSSPGARYDHVCVYVLYARMKCERTDIIIMHRQLVVCELYLHMHTLAHTDSVLRLEREERYGCMYMFEFPPHTKHALYPDQFHLVRTSLSRIVQHQRRPALSFVRAHATYSMCTFEAEEFRSRISMRCRRMAGGIFKSIYSETHLHLICVFACGY